MTPTWWPRGPAPGNLGDVLTPVILRAFGVDARWAPQPRAVLLATGSIIRFARPRQSVWGSGAMRGTDRPSPKARYLAVRGPLTRECVLKAGGSCPEVYGDPALLLPRFHNGHVERDVEVGVVPHYRDWKLVRGHRINPLSATPLKVVDEIRRCQVVYSSSLHGIIVAHAYGIPAAWVKWSDNLDGDGTKFRDYAESVGVELVPYPTIAKAKPVLPKSIDTQPLLNALEALGG